MIISLIKNKDCFYAEFYSIVVEGDSLKAEPRAELRRAEPIQAVLSQAE